MKAKRMLAMILMAAMALIYMPALAEGAYSETPLGLSSENKRHNIGLACDALDGWVILSGETFSFNDAVGPRTADYGYKNAENGRSARVRGGGVAQVATTLYLAVRELSGVSIDTMRSYGAKFSDGYVDDPADAVLVDYNAGTDFVFTNWGDTLTISMWTDGDSVCCSTSTGSAQGGLIGFGQTYVDGASARRSNIGLAAQSIDGTVLEPGEEFSFNDIVGPRTADNGYQNAVNGRGVKVRGGGVAQVASTLYLAVKDLADVSVTEKRTYGDSYNQTYVSDPDDAIVTDYNVGTDFAFRNVGPDPLIIGMEIDEHGFLCCTVSAQADSPDWEDDWFFDDDFVWDEGDGQWVLGENGEWIWESAWEWLE